MNKKWMLGLAMAVGMMGMSATAHAGGKWWFCYDFGEDYTDINKKVSMIYYSTVFYSKDTAYVSDFDNTIHHKKFLSHVSRCNYYNTKKRAKHEREKRISDEMNRSIEVRYTGFDG